MSDKENKRTLARHVTVAGTTYGPGDDVPDHIAAQITNPKAWVSQEEADATAAEDAGRKEAGTAGGRTLLNTVTVGGNSYGPGDFIPDDIAAQITNPKAWAQAPEGSKTAKGESTGDDADTGGGKDPDKAAGKKAAPAAKK